MLIIHWSRANWITTWISNCVWKKINKREWMRISYITSIRSLRSSNKIRKIFISSFKNSRIQIKIFCIARFIITFELETKSLFAWFHRILRFCYCLTNKFRILVLRFRCRLQTKWFAISLAIRIYTSFCDVRN